MSQKRKGHPSSSSNNYPKRPRYSNADAGADSKSASTAPIDPTYGQRSAFPGLDLTGNDDGLFYGPASDGFEYLRMVRQVISISPENFAESEAKGVPNLLTAPKSEEQERDDLYQDYPQGYYEDGAYTAAPASTTAQYGDSGQEHDVDPQEAYYAALLDRFQRLSNLLRSPASSSPPQESLFTQSTLTTATKLTTGPSKVWRVTFLYTRPTTKLLSHLDQDTVVAGIAALGKHLSWSNVRKSRYMGAWAWGLLARCREVGMMGSEEVAVLRDLGKKARQMVEGVDTDSGAKEEVQHDWIGESSDSDEDENHGGNETGYDDALSSDAGEDSVISRHQASDVGDGHHDTSNQQQSLDTTIAESQTLATVDEDISQAKQRLLATIEGPPVSETVDPTIEETSTDRPNLPASPRSHPSPSIKQATFPSAINKSSIQELESNSTVAAADQLADQATAAIPDMLITIIGERFGQRDLSDGRIVWT
ncbi:MAG: hypothetical protein Q9220_006941 [cf. Caloplaca sp. 1 TL-2023]